MACPGRLEDLMKQGLVRLDRVEITVLDEADHMADLGFLPGVTRILAATPQGGQRMLFSATLDRGVDTPRPPLPPRRDPPRGRRVQSVPQGEMTHRVFLVGEPTRRPRSSSTSRPAVAAASCSPAPSTRPRSSRRLLTAAGIPSVDLHGNLSQAARERNLAAFGADPDKGGVRVLVATDVAARGVHVDDVELVVHVDPPMEHKAYLHRSGRTARAGAAGIVVTVAIASQRGDVTDLLRKAGITAPLEQVGAESAPITELVGERAEHVRPAPVQAPQQQRSGGGRPRNGGGAPRTGAPSGGGRGGASRSGGGRSGGASTAGASTGGGRSGGASTGGGRRASTGGRSGGGQPRQDSARAAAAPPAVARTARDRRRVRSPLVLQLI